MSDTSSIDEPLDVFNRTKQLNCNEHNESNAKSQPTITCSEKTFSQPLQDISQRKASSLSENRFLPPILNQEMHNNSKKRAVSKQRLFLARTRSRSLDREEGLHESHSSTDVLKQMIELKFELKHVSQRIEKIQQLLQTFVTSSVNETCETSAIDFLEMLPLNSVEETDHINNQITIDQTKLKKLVQLLYLIGGENPKKIMHRCNWTMHKYGQMSKIMTNEICKENSCLGKLKKRSFTILKLYSAILAATIRKIELKVFITPPCLLTLPTITHAVGETLQYLQSSSHSKDIRNSNGCQKFLIQKLKKLLESF